jgi:small-conductance mechanosensitive channel
MKEIFSIPLITHTAIALALLVGSVLAGRMIKILFSWLFKSISRQTKTTLDDRLFSVILGRLTTLTVLIGIFIALDEVRKGVTKHDMTVLQILGYLDIVAYVGAVLIVGKIIADIIESVIEWYIEERSQKKDDKLTATITPMTSKIVSIAIFLMAAMVILDHFNINIGSLLVSLGVASLAVALAAQDTIANMIGGFVIIVDRPFRVGDRIQLPSGELGDVVEIGLRSTRILNPENNLLVIPNAELVKSRIVNFAYPHNQVKVLVNVGVAYGVNLETVKRVMLTVANNHPHVLHDPPAEVHLIDFGDSSLQFRLICSTDDFKMRFPTETSLREQLYEAFQKEGIEIPYPQRVVTMKNSNAS